MVVICLKSNSFNFEREKKQEDFLEVKCIMLLLDKLPPEENGIKFVTWFIN